MIIDGKHRRWGIATGAAAAVLTLAYALYAALTAGGPRGGTWTGIAFGSAAFGVFVFECLLSLRKRYPASPVGRVQTWLRAHLWLGTLAVALVLFHTGFRWGEGLGSVTMWLFAAVTLSGVLGVILQATLPQRMTRLVTRETLYDQIPSVIKTLRREADERVEFVTADLGVEDPEPDRIWAGGKKYYFDEAQKKSAAEKVEAERQKRKASPQIATDDVSASALKTHYLREVRPFLTANPPSICQQLFRDGPSVAAYFRRLRILVPEAAHPVLADLESICDERRQLAIQKRLHEYLHGWLYAHVPLSFALLVMTAVHAVMSLWY
ncbi:MAG: hypothetical protein SFV54_29000 [Bryobacteraceae bacterium]|nr:hypothetical protein [Bryobacteraceae bacterium]